MVFHVQWFAQDRTDSSATLIETESGTLSIVLLPLQDHGLELNPIGWDRLLMCPELYFHNRWLLVPYRVINGVRGFGYFCESHNIGYFQGSQRILDIHSFKINLMPFV